VAGTGEGASRGGCEIKRETGGGGFPKQAVLPLSLGTEGGSILSWKSLPSLFISVANNQTQVFDTYLCCCKDSSLI
jgi:hypothetical protein